MFEFIKMMVEEPPTADHYKLLCSIYNYLTLLVFNRIENKIELMKYIDYVLPHLKFRVGAPHFVYHLCFNNKLLVDDEELVKKIISAIISALEQFGINDYERSLLMYTFRSLVFFN